MKLNVSGNIGIADAMCGTVRQREDGERLLVGTVKECARKGGRAVRKCESIDEILSLKLKQNLKFKSFGSGRKIGTFVSGMGSPLKGSSPQLRLGKLSKKENEKFKEKVKPF